MTEQRAETLRDIQRHVQCICI